jgi:hypothetical protein
MPTKSTLPKPIAELIARESELQASVDRWGVPAFRSERDRLEAIVHSGAASDAEIEAHAASRDGGEVDLHYRSMEGSSRAALDAHRSTNWQAFREFLKGRLAARREREQAIVNDVAALREKHGILIDYSDPEAATTSQLALIVSREDVGFVRFGDAAETF